MKKSRIALCALLVVALAIGGAISIDRAQAQVSASRLVDLTPAITTSTPVTTVAPMPVGKQVRAFQRLLGVLKVTASPSGGSGATLDVWY